MNKNTNKNTTLPIDTIAMPLGIKRLNNVVIEEKAGIRTI